MCADVVGYSRLMGIDEEGTLAALRPSAAISSTPKSTEHKGRIVRTMGDGLLVEFNSVVDAVRCAVEVQREMPEHGAAMPADRRIQFRIAINMGDVVSDGDLIYGDGVAVASRMESLAEPGGINVSRAVRDQVRDRLPIAFEDLGEHEVKNIARPVRVFRIVLTRPHGGAGDGSRPPQNAAARPEKPAVAVLPFQNLGGDAEAEFFLDSVAEDLITELARARWFSVVARNTSFSYKGKGADASNSPASSASAMWSRAACARPATGFASAASSSRRRADSICGPTASTARSKISFDLQDRITESVIGSVEPVLRDAEIERARRKPEASQRRLRSDLARPAVGLCRDRGGQSGGAAAARPGAGGRSRATRPPTRLPRGAASSAI